jgi:Dolichyl-phosphate-mannose-protein mannosyltransferase
MKRETWLLYALALLKLFLPYLLQNSAYEPHRDEFLYLAEGHHLAWGYMEVPPLLSVFAWLTHLFGDGMFFIKFWPSLGGAATYFLVGRVILHEGGKAFAIFLAWTPFLFGGFLRLHFLFQANFLDVFFWTALAYALVRYKATGLNRYLYIAGVCMGLGMLGKYTVAFYIVALLIGLLFTADRRIFTNKHLYFACAIGLLLFLPNLIWQYQRGFPVVYHMAELQKNQLQYLNPITFVVSQLLVFLPCVVIWVTGLISLAIGRTYRFIAWSYVLVIALLLATHGKAYYAMGAYPILFAFGSLKIEGWMRGRRFILRFALSAVVLVLGFFYVRVDMPFLPPAQLADLYARRHVARLGVLRWEDGKDHPLPQDFADMLAWREMTAKFAHAYDLLDSTEKAHTLLFCDNYGQAGALNYYGPQYHLPPSYSDNASFLYWLPDNFYEFDNIVLLTDDIHEMEHPFIHNFRQAILVDSVTAPYARERGSLIILLKGPDSTVRKMFIDKIAMDKKKTSPE